MKNPGNPNRREFLQGTAAITAASLAVTEANAAEPDFVIDAPNTVSMGIANSTQRFPVRRVYCLGRNYRAHAIESGDNPDETPPFFFIKPRDAVVDARDGFPYPPMTRALRYEVELVVALQSGGSDIRAEDALDHIYGYGVGLDMTRQDLQETAQSLSRPWAISKSFDKSAPCGPLYPVKPHGHAISGGIWLKLNGETRQDSTLDLQRWSVPQAIEILSKHYELAAGDLILTGTPAGIGLVERGDTINAGIDGLGSIEVAVT